MPEAILRVMRSADYPALFELWNSVPGFNRGLRSLDDSEAGIHKFLKRNPQTCFVAEIDNKIIGGILAGHDGRRGYIYHAIVLPEFQGRGIGNQLAQHACNALPDEGIHRAHMLLFSSNEQGNGFWESQGWQTRPDLTYRNKSLNDENR